MFTGLRTLRHLGVIALLASPGVGGSVVQALYPCPVVGPAAVQVAPHAGSHTTPHATAPPLLV